MASSPLKTNWGIAFVCLIVVTMLFGMALLQVWLYFLWYPKDSWKLKTLVLVLTAVELAEVVMYIDTTYDVLINHVGDPAFADILKPIDALQYYLSYIAALIVQLYFARTVYALGTSTKSKVAAGAIIFTSFSSVALTTVIAVLVKDIGLFSAINTPTTTKLVIVQTTMSVSCDLLIAVSLSILFRVRQSQTATKGTTEMLQILMINAVNRGVLVAIFALLHVILFLAMPEGELYYFIGFKIASQLYMNTMMATLNSREHIRRIGDRQPDLSTVSNSNSFRSSGQRDLRAMEFNVETLDLEPWNRRTSEIDKWPIDSKSAYSHNEYAHH